MHRIKFVLLMVCILLVGAVAAGLAAMAVITPRTGKTVSAGVLSVPSELTVSSNLGLSTEDVLFYHWYGYEARPVSLIPEEYWNETAPAASLSGAFEEALGVSYFREKLMKSMVWNWDGTSDGLEDCQLFLKEFPAVWGEEQTPVFLDYAVRDGDHPAVSWLVRPQETRELTGEQRQAALEKVKNDLAGFFLATSADWTENELSAFVVQVHEYCGKEVGFTEFEGLCSRLAQLLQTHNFTNQWEAENISSHATLEYLEDFAVRQFDSCTIQLISTPQQIVLLINVEEYNKNFCLAVYYDVQLERYSGLGMSLYRE